MADTPDNVISLPPSTMPVPRQRRKKDPRAAARQAKLRSKNKSDRDARRSTDLPPAMVADAPPIAPIAPGATHHVTRDDGATAPRPSGIVVSYAPAFALEVVSAGFSITGFTAIFVGSYWPVIAMGIALELGKLRAVTALPSLRWGPLRAALIVLVAVLMGLNAIGCYGFLAKAHIGHQVEGDVRVAAHAADIDARISVQAGVVSDIDHRIAQIDKAVETATQRGRTRSAMQLAEDQRKTRADLASKRITEAKTLAGLQVEKAGIEGQQKVVDADLGPVRYLATLIGAGDQDVLRWFILVIALLLDPAAVLLLLAATRRAPPCR